MQEIFSRSPKKNVFVWSASVRFGNVGSIYNFMDICFEFLVERTESESLGLLKKGRETMTFLAKVFFQDKYQTVATNCDKIGEINELYPSSCHCFHLYKMKTVLHLLFFQRLHCCSPYVHPDNTRIFWYFS